MCSLKNQILYNMFQCIYQASKDWNNLDNNIKSSESMSFFKAKLKSL